MRDIQSVNNIIIVVRVDEWAEYMLQKQVCSAQTKKFFCQKDDHKQAQARFPWWYSG